MPRQPPHPGVRAGSDGRGLRWPADRDDERRRQAGGQRQGQGADQRRDAPFRDPTRPGGIESDRRDRERPAGRVAGPSDRSGRGPWPSAASRPRRDGCSRPGRPRGPVGSPSRSPGPSDSSRSPGGSRTDETYGFSAESLCRGQRSDRRVGSTRRERLGLSARSLRRSKIHRPRKIAAIRGAGAGVPGPRPNPTMRSVRHRRDTASLREGGRGRRSCRKRFSGAAIERRGRRPGSRGRSTGHTRRGRRPNRPAASPRPAPCPSSG